MPILGVIASSYQSAGAAGYYNSIATVTVGAGGASSISFSGIPATYTHLQIRGISKTDRATYALDNIAIRLGNGSIDTGNNYSYHRLESDATTAGAPSGSNATSTSYAGLGSTISSAGPGSFAGLICDILDYANTNKNKTVRMLTSSSANGLVGGLYSTVTLTGGAWRNTAAVTNITLVPAGGGTNFLQYSTFALYGIKVA